jgi:hypothetical protein
MPQGSQRVFVYTRTSQQQVTYPVTQTTTLTERFAWLSTSTARAVDQAWFWTPEWQAGEREADRNIRAGRTTYFDSDEEFLAALDRELS